MNYLLWRSICLIAFLAIPARGVTTIEQNAWGEKLISVKLVEVSMADFLRVISDVSGLNILIDPDVQGSLTIQAKKVPWDQLLETVLESQGLTHLRQGNILRISRKQTLHQEAKADYERERELSLQEELLTKVKRLKYSRGKELIVPLQTLLSERGRINLDQRSNALIIRDIRKSVERISRLVDTLDKPLPQVEIEARIVEATTKFSRQLGVQLGFQLGESAHRFRAGVSVIAPIDHPAGSVSVSGGKLLDTFALDAAIAAAESTGDAKMISKPRVSTVNNMEARIIQGAKIPIPVQMNYTTNVRYETAALHLSVRPQITEKGKVSLDIKVENSVPDFSQTVRDIPTILTSESHTRVLLADGATTIIGGIYIEKDRNGEFKVPGFSGIPIIGHLFKRSDKASETREVLFFITSRIQGDT
jgi:type IV pilus assembly protein PilQ